jgi:hypothetical protein
MSRETKLGYGFLLVGSGLPYLVDKLLGPIFALITAAVCFVGGIAFLVAGHLHRNKKEVRFRGVMATIGMFTLVGAASGALIGSLSGAIWSVAHKTAATATPPVVPDEPPTLLGLFNKDFPNVNFKLADSSTGIEWKDGTSLRIRRQVYLDFLGKTEFVGYYIPASPSNAPDRTFNACIHLANEIRSTIQDLSKIVSTYGDTGGATRSQDLVFSGRVFLYHEEGLTNRQRAAITLAYESKHLDVQFRGPEYLSVQLADWDRKHTKQ